jgi:hypothetical protein
LADLSFLEYGYRCMGMEEGYIDAVKRSEEVSILISRLGDASSALEEKDAELEDVRIHALT